MIYLHIPTSVHFLLYIAVAIYYCRAVSDPKLNQKRFVTNMGIMTAIGAGFLFYSAVT